MSLIRLGRTSNVRRDIGLFLLACFAALLFAKPAYAQQGAGVLTGRVAHAYSGRRLEDVVVSVTSPALQGDQVVTTDATGAYRIPSLPPGVYTIQFEKEDFRPYSRDQILLRADATIRFDVQLMPTGLIVEPVIVSAPAVDIGSTAAGANIDSDFTSRVPLVSPGAHGGAQRTFESVAVAAPGAAADLYGTSINGATSPENSYVIDGLRTNSTKYATNGSPLTMEFIKEVNVLSGGYMPEYGRSTGGILNVVTKSGSNDYHGSLWANWSPGALEGARKYPNFAGSAVQTRRSLGNVYDIGFDQSGPIVQDKLWYYVGFDASRAIYHLDRSVYRNIVQPNGTVTGTEEITGDAQRFDATATSYQIFGKLDYRVNQDNKLALTFAATPTAAGGGGDYSLAPNSGLVEGATGGELNLSGRPGDLAHVRRAGAYDTILKWTSEFDNKSKNLETTLGWHHELGGSLSADGFNVGSHLGYANLQRVAYRRNTPTYHDLSDFESAPGCGYITVTNANGTRGSVPTCPEQLYYAGGPGFTDQQVLDTYSARSILTVLARGLGHHVIKVGAEFEGATSWHSRGYSGGRILQETGDGSRFDEVRGYGYLKGPDDPVFIDRLVSRSHSINVSGFAQDSWAIADVITLNVGIRYDNQFMIGNDGKLFLSFPNQISPRVGLIYDPTQKGRSKIYVSYARFNEDMPLDITDRLTGEPQIFSSVSPAACNPLDPAQAAGVCRSLTVHPKFPVKRGWARGGTPDRQYGPSQGGKEIVDPDISIQSESELSAGADYEVMRDARIGVSYVRRWMNDIVETMSNDNAASYFVGNPGKGIGSAFPEALRNYDAGTIYFTKAFTHQWLAQVSYTLSWLRGNISGLYRPETGQLDPNLNSTFDLVSLLVNQTGDLPHDHRHSIKVYAAKDFEIGTESVVSLGASIQARSGAPSNYLGAHPIYGAGEAYILPRGSGDRLPWNGDIGTHTGYTWRFREGMSLSFTVDIFNLFNFQGPLSVDENYTRESVIPIANGSRSDLPNVKTTAGKTLTAAQLNPNFGNANQYQEPRQFRFGVRGNF